MKISIITVVYNNTLVSEALDSILSQRLDAGDELELVVIDGGSIDGTIDVIEGYRDQLAVLVSEKDNGIYDALNKGLERVTGDVIGMLNSDDLYQDNNVLAEVVRTFNNSEIQVVYGDLVYVRKDNPQQVVRYWKSKPYHEGLFEKGWMPPHPTFFVRKEVYENFGIFDLNYRLASDFDLTLRILSLARVPSIHIPKILVRMRLGGATNKSLRNILRGNLECYRACKKHGLKITPWFIPQKIISRVPQFFMISMVPKT